MTGNPTPQEAEFSKHMDECETCSLDDPNVALCPSGFSLMQEALRSRDRPVFHSPTPRELVNEISGK